MKYKLLKDIMNVFELRNAFNKLSKETFDVSFEDWYQSGYWSKSNIPYTLFDGEKAISNVSVNKMEILYNGHIHNHIQLGTVMTDITYRNQGLSRYIMNEVINDYKLKCDSIFLIANSTVKDFYPKFGFKREKQYQYTMDIKNAIYDAQKLDMENINHIDLLKKYYLKTNPFSKLQVINNFSLLMFYCSSFMKDNVFYSPFHDAVIIAKKEDNTLYCYDIFCDCGKNLNDIISSVLKDEYKIIFNFTPNDDIICEKRLVYDDDSIFFVLEGGENIYENEMLAFPLISYT